MPPGPAAEVFLGAGAFGAVGLPERRGEVTAAYIASIYAGVQRR